MAQIVRDDVVVLRRGDQVPVDGEVLVSDGLDMDEALLTGENDPVPKTPGDAVLSGSAVVAGAGLVRATAVGSASHAARLSAEARRYSAIHSELRGALEKVARWLTIALVPIIAVILMLFSDHASTASLAFLIGWVVGLTVVVLAVTVVVDPVADATATEPSTTSILGQAWALTRACSPAVM